MSFLTIVSRQIERLGSGSVNSVLAAYRCGEYQSALNQCENLRKDSPEYFYWKGVLLQKLDRLEESEAVLRKGTEARRDATMTSRTYEALGTTLGDLGRLGEAIASFEESMRHGPERSARHRAMAAAWLADESQSAKALAEAQVAARIAYSDSVDDPDPDKTDLLEAVSTLAWAVAANDHNEWEIGKLDRETSALSNPRNKPAMALMHYSMGRAYHALGKTEASDSHFEKAVAVEPEGNFGRLARAALS